MTADVADTLVALLAVIGVLVLLVVFEGVMTRSDAGWLAVAVSIAVFLLCKLYRKVKRNG